MIAIRRAERNDIPSVMKFIDQYWKKDHICAANRKFFEWMYGNGEQINFNIAIDERTGEIWGINGFVCYNSEEHPDVSGALWKARKISESPMLGIELGNYLKTVTGYSHNFSIGVSKRACLLEQLRGKKVTELKRYYMLNDTTEYKIAKIRYVPHRVPDIKETYFEPVSDISEFKQWITEKELRKKTPYKDYSYISHRYFEHPIYSYQMLGVCEGEKKYPAVFVGRIVEQNGTGIFKIIDFFGNDEIIGKSYTALHGWMKQNEFEYMDFYEYGISDEYMKKAGFELLEGDDNIIPNYFEPFEQVNVRIPIVMRQGDTPHLYRGDADQDRPSFTGRKG